MIIKQKIFGHHAVRTRNSSGRRFGMIAVAFAVLGAFGYARSQGNPGMTSPEMVEFLAQCIMADEGTVNFGAQTRGCETGPSKLTDKLAWRKFDWPGKDDPRSAPTGYLASDAIVLADGPTQVIAHLADFGDHIRRFRHFDAGKGDGGQVVQILDGAAYGVMTEDGGAGYQWFVSPACQQGADARDRLKSWLFFKDDARPGRWRDEVVSLTMVRSHEGCATGFSQSYTRYRRETFAVPFIKSNGSVRTTSKQDVDSIVSEHYGRGSIETADHLERFFFGRGLGMFRWERWEQRQRTLQKGVDAQAARLANSGRCPSMAYSVAPAANWIMTDCRMWTNLIVQQPPWSPVDFGWPGPLNMLTR